MNFLYIRYTIVTCTFNFLIVITMIIICSFLALIVNGAIFVVLASVFTFFSLVLKWVVCLL